MVGELSKATAAPPCLGKKSRSDRLLGFFIPNMWLVE